MWWYSIHLWSIGGGTSAINICAFCYMLNIFGVVVFHRSMVNWRRGPWNISILLYVKLLWCSSIAYIYGQLEGGYICPKYMCILLYVKLIWCSGIPYIYGQLEEGHLGICSFCYMSNFCGVAVFHTSMVNWRVGTSALSICAFCYM